MLGYQIIGMKNCSAARPLARAYTCSSSSRAAANMQAEGRYFLRRAHRASPAVTRYRVMSELRRLQTRVQVEKHL